MEANFYIPDIDEFKNGYTKYDRLEVRGPIYFEATDAIAEGWGNPRAMAQGVKIIINGWNRFYARFDLEKLIAAIERHMNVLDQFRNRDISSFSSDDETSVKALFNDFLHALRRTHDNRASAVSVAKALSPMVTNFLPLWDSTIAYNYQCYYIADSADVPYIEFCKKMKSFAEIARAWVPNSDDRSLLKRIDEYNYSKYTMRWI